MGMWCYSMEIDGVEKRKEEPEVAEVDLHFQY